MAGGRPHAVLLQALEEREPNLREHVSGVATLSLLVGRRLGLDDAGARGARARGTTARRRQARDPRRDPRKPGPLDEGEQAFIHQHTMIGQRILDASPALNEVGGIVRARHERWDGNGYPDSSAETRSRLPRGSSPSATRTAR